MTRDEYLNQMKNDIIDWITDNDYTLSGDRDSDYEDLNDTLWDEDSVTGNGSGSYTFNSDEAFNNLRGAEDLIGEIIPEFGIEAGDIAEHFFDWEYWDVTIRCYLLGEAIDLALDELEGE